MIKRALLTTILLYLLSLTMSYSQVSRFEHKTFINESGDSLNYRLLYPDYNKSRKYPLVIFLHGSGERGSDNEAQLKWGVQNFATDENMAKYPAIVIAPQCPKDQWWSNFKNTPDPEKIELMKSPSKPMELVVELIYKTIETFHIDTTRIYITGLSMGGYGTFDAIERYPDLFAAAVPVCGGGDPGKAADIAHMPIWIFHGAEDPSVNSRYSLNMVEALNKAGAHPGFTLYPEVGHFSWLHAYSDPLMIEWLFRQHK